MCRNILLFYFIVFSCAMVIAQYSVEDYFTIKEEYAHLQENDGAALPAVRKNIHSARKRLHFRHLFYAYEDAALYSPDREDKLRFADSCLHAALALGDEGLVSTALLGKGIIYYFNFRKFDKALDQYLKASKSAEKTDDKYLKYKIKYNIGVVKSYLGYYSDALLYFQECRRFFENNLKYYIPSALRFNNTRGYLNTLHQMMICERNLHNWSDVDHLILLTDSFHSSDDFTQEKGYFLKEKGIATLRKGNWERAADSLHAAVGLLQHRKEEGHLSVTYYYLANAYLKIGDLSKSLTFLRKIDSLFVRNEAVFPEIPRAYGLLLKNGHFHLSADDKKHFTRQLMKVDSILLRDLPHLSSRIYSEYDTKGLLVDKENLVQAKNIRNTVIAITLLLIFGLLFFLYRSHGKHKKNVRSFTNLLQKYEVATSGKPGAQPRVFPRKSEYSAELIERLLKKLDEFEEKKGFTSKEVTLESLARKFHTNKTHLSYVINEHKQMTWSNYLKNLRITYITDVLLNDPVYLNYNIGALGEMAGFRSRQQFSKQFLEVHNLRPVDFIMLRIKQNK